MKTIAFYTPNYIEVIKPLCASAEKFEARTRTNIV